MPKRVISMKFVEMEKKTRVSKIRKNSLFFDLHFGKDNTNPNNQGEMK